MFKFFRSPFYNFESARILSSTSTGGCEIGEFLEAAGKVKLHDPESWHNTWHEQSVRAEGVARDAVRSGQRHAARRAFIRASNYARASGYMLSWSGKGDGRVLQSSERAVSLFRESMPYMDGLVKVLEIPYDHVNSDSKAPLTAYLYLPSQSNRMSSSLTGQGQKPQRDTPVIINCNGADSTQEELYHAFVAPGLEQGYAVLTFEGPGQGLMLKKHKTVMRPDFEVVTSRVLDHLEGIVTLDSSAELSSLDLNRVAIMGVSMGGYYALRAAMDTRIKACVSVDPFYGLWRLALTRMPGWYASLWTSGWLPESVFNASVYAQMAVDFPTRWEFELGMAMMGTSTPGDTLRRFRDFDLDVVSDGSGGSVVDRIRCPVLVTGASTSIYASADESTMKIFRGLSGVAEGKKEVWIPQEIGAGGLSGKIGAWSLLAQKSLEFLDKHLGVERVEIGT